MIGPLAAKRDSSIYSALVYDQAGKSVVGTDRNNRAAFARHVHAYGAWFLPSRDLRELVAVLA